MTGVEAAIYREVMLDPRDDTPRLVYADWLADNGDADHAELIQWQVNQKDDGKRIPPAALRAVARIEAVGPVWQVSHLGNWTVRLSDLGGKRLAIARGFITELYGFPLEDCKRLARLCPLEKALPNACRPALSSDGRRWRWYGSARSRVATHFIPLEVLARLSRRSQASSHAIYPTEAEALDDAARAYADYLCGRPLSSGFPKMREGVPA
jgi:uncharacterized protein (TIGR02996 family)